MRANGLVSPLVAKPSSISLRKPLGPAFDVVSLAAWVRSADDHDLFFLMFFSDELLTSS
jgi:hypothetical protein